MPYNGTGQFVRIHNWTNEAAANTPILPGEFDEQEQDIAVGLGNCITRDGQGGPTADIPWNNFGITGLRAPLLANDAATKKYVDDVDAATRVWVGGTTTALPSQTGKAGSALVTDGVQASFQPITPFSNSTILAQLQAAALYF
jgi:hypothetical protein